MAKIETLVDDFSAGNVNWEALTAVVAPMYTFTGGHIQYEVGGVGPIAAGMETVSDFDFTDSWFSIELIDYAFPSATNAVYYQAIAAHPDTSHLQYYIFLYYDPSTDTVNISDSLSNAAIIANPGVPIVIASRHINTSSTISLSYSLDSGASWIDVGTQPSTMDNTPVRLLMFSQGSGDAISELVRLDNFNAYEPAIPVIPLVFAVPVSFATASIIPPMMPIRVPVARATVTGHPHINIIYNGIFINMESLHADATVTVPVAGTGIHLGINLFIPARADATVTGIPYTGIAYGAPEYLIGPALINARALAPTISFSEGTIFTSIPAANVQADAVDVSFHVGPFVPGDLYNFPLRIYGLGGSVTYDMTSMTTDSHDAIGFGTYPRTIWIDYDADAPSTVTISTDYAGSFAMGFVQPEDPIDTFPWSFIDSVIGGTPVTLDVNTGKTRIWIGTDASAGTFSLTWTATPTLGGLLMDIKSPILDRTPDNLTVSVLGGTPDEHFKFVWSPPASTLIPSSTARPITLADVKSDPEGNLLTGTIPLPPVFHGNYVLEVIGLQSGKVATANFTILNDPLPQDSESDDVDPVAQPGTKWFWDDARGHTWEMESNPTAATRVVFPKNLTAERTTSGSGQHIVWQGIVPTIDWSFNGTLLDEAEYEQFEFFLALNRKFYITNQKGVTYIVTLKSFEPKPHKNQSNFWTFDYSCTAIVYGTKGGE